MTSEIFELIFRAKDMASGAVSGLRGGMQDLTNTQKTYRSSLESLSGPANQFKNIIMQLGAAVGVAGLAKSFININSSAEKTKLMLEGLTGSTEKANEAFQWILDFSTKAPFSIDALKNSFVKLQVAGLDPMSGSLQTLTDALSAFGGSDQDLELAAVAIQQMAGKGVISMEELRQQLGEKVPTAMQAMADGMGMSMAQLSKAIESGSVSASIGLSAMMGQLEEMYGGRGQSMMMSWTGIISNVKVEWEKFMLTLGETGIFNQLKATIDGVLKKIDEMKASGELEEWANRISTTAKALIDLFLKLAGIFVTVIDALGPFLPMLVTTIAYFKTLQLVVGGAIAPLFALSDAVKFFKTTASGLAAAGGPVTLAIVAITALIGTVMALRYAFDDVRIAQGKYDSAIKDSGNMTKQATDIQSYVDIIKSEKTTIVEKTAAYDKLRAVMGNMLPVYSSVLQAVQDIADKNSAASKAIQEFTDKAMGDAAKTQAKGAMQLIQTYNELGGKLEWLRGLQAKYGDSVLSVSDTMTVLGMGALSVGGAMEKTQGKFDELTPKVEGAKKKMANLSSELWEAVKATGGVDAALIKDVETMRGAIKVAEDLSVAKNNLKKTYEDFISGIEKGSADWIAIEEKRVATLEAKHAEEKAQLDKALAEKTISQADYYAKIKAMDDEEMARKVALVEAQIALEKSKGNEANFQKIAELEEKKTQAVLKGSTDRVKLETDATKETTKKHEDAFSKWQELKELELQSLKSKLDLQAAMDEAAAAQGIISQSELLSRKLAQATEYYEAQVEKAEETAARIAVTEGEGSKAYADAIAEKTKLQDEWQINVIQSEETIRVARIKEITEAAGQQVHIAVDALDAIAVARTAALEKERELLNEGLILHAEYAANVAEIEAQAAADREAQLNKEHEERLSGLLNYIAQSYAYLDDVGNRVSEAFKTEDLFSSLADGFSNATKVLTLDYVTMMNEVADYTKDRVTNLINTIGNYGTGVMKDVYLFGRNVSNLTDEQISQWADQVTYYVQRVKDLFASLQDTISNYQDQLDQMQGNEAAILDRWHQEQIDRLEETYGENLKNTAEYQQALTLIEELYAEKRTKIAEKEQRDKANAYVYDFPDPAQGIKDKLNNSGANSQPVTASAPFQYPGAVQQIQMDFDVNFNVNNPDTQAAGRWIRDTFMPIFLQQLKLKGIKIT